MRTLFYLDDDDHGGSRKQASTFADHRPNPGWGDHYGGDGPNYMTPQGPVWMFRKRQSVRFYDITGSQVGPEQSNVAPAVAYAHSEGWQKVWASDQRRTAGTDGNYSPDDFTVDVSFDPTWNGWGFSVFGPDRHKWASGNGYPSESEARQRGEETRDAYLRTWAGGINDMIELHTGARKTASQFAPGDRVSVTWKNGVQVQGQVTEVDTNPVSGLEFIMFAEDGPDSDLPYPVYTNGNMGQVINKTASRKVAWTEDGSDITPMAQRLMDLTDKSTDSEAWNTVGGYRLSVEQFLAEQIRPMVGQITDADRDCLEDYNYHVTNRAIDRALGKTASRKTASPLAVSFVPTPTDSGAEAYEVVGADGFTMGYVVYNGSDWTVTTDNGITLIRTVDHYLDSAKVLRDQREWVNGKTASRRTAANDDGIMEAAKVVADYWGGAGSKIGTPQKGTIQLEDGPYEAVFVNITSGDGEFYRVQDISGQVNPDDLVNYRPDPARPGMYTWDEGYIPKNTYKVFSRYEALFTLRKMPDGRWQKDPEYNGKIIPTASRKTAMPAPADLGISVGDIFYNSWGYDQTQIDYYKVVRLTPAGVEIVPIGQRFVERNGPGGDSVVPDPNLIRDYDVITGLERGGKGSKVCRVKGDGGRYGPYIVLSDRYSASKWDGRPDYQTDSMFGR